MVFDDTRLRFVPSRTTKSLLEKVNAVRVKRRKEVKRTKDPKTKKSYMAVRYQALDLAEQNSFDVINEKCKDTRQRSRLYHPFFPNYIDTRQNRYFLDSTLPSVMDPSIKTRNSINRFSGAALVKLAVQR